MNTALTCLKVLAETFGAPFDPASAADAHGLGEAEPDLAVLATMAKEAGFEAVIRELCFDDLAGFRDEFPFLARLRNGNTVIILGFRGGLEDGQALVADPMAHGFSSFEVNREALGKSWDGQALLARPRLARSALRALVMLGRHHGLDLSLESLVHTYALQDEEPSPAMLVRIAREQGLAAKEKHIGVAGLSRLGLAYPFLARLKNGRNVIVCGYGPGPDGEPAADVVDALAFPIRHVPMNNAALEELWDGKGILAKRKFSLSETNQPFGWRWFIPEFAREKRVFIDAGIAAIMMTLLGLAVPLYFQVVIDKVLVHYSLSTLQVLSIGMLAAILFEGGFHFLRGYLILHGASKIDIRVATRTFAHLVSLPLRFFGKSHAGVLIQHMQQADKIREFLSGKLFFTLLDACSLFIFMPVLFFYSVELSLVVTGFSLLLAGFLTFLLPYFRERLYRLYRAEGERQSYLVEAIRGMETVKSLSLEPVKRRKWDEKAARAVTMRLNVGKISTSATAAIGFLEKAMSLAIPWLGVYLVFDGKMTVGSLIAFQMLSGRVTGPLSQIVSLIHEYQEKALSVRMLGQIMNEPVERTSAGTGLRPHVKGQVEFENAVFSYSPDNPPVVRGVSCTFKAGQVIGVVGRSGSGKSTLARLVQGLYACDSGVVRIDGHDIRELDLTYLRRHIGVVLQENFLFHGSVRENIAMTKPGATFDEIVWASKLSGADEFIERLPKGFDTILEENGSNLSGGQKQRLAIARALLTHPRILIFDEATSALDAESEEIIQNNLDRMASGRTMIIISHRLSMLAKASAVLVVDQGQVVDFAPQDILLSRCKIYQDLWKSQNRHILGEGAPRLSLP
jgi:ATP-binding cassette, subfamily B, bacterial HlyB/CyaB